MRNGHVDVLLTPIFYRASAISYIVVNDDAERRRLSENVLEP